MIVLGFESSCDETGIGIVCTKKGLITHKLHSQITTHQEYGGVVPELASRDHIRYIMPLVQEALSEANLTINQVDAVAYTAGPGLAGALLVGASIAQSIAWARHLPVIPVNHLEGHLLSSLLSTPSPDFPFLALLVSGGHTQLIAVEGVGRYHLLGETLDDAAGEAFDKSAQLLGLPYPGGPALAKLAETGRPGQFHLPRPMLNDHQNLDFSFSGLKTAVFTLIKGVRKSGTLDEQTRSDIAAEIQSAIVDTLEGKCVCALKKTSYSRLSIVGGVGANTFLRQRMKETIPADLFFPPPMLCTDNGAMIAFTASERIKAGLAEKERKTTSAFTVFPRWSLANRLVLS